MNIELMSSARVSVPSSVGSSALVGGSLAGWQSSLGTPPPFAVAEMSVVYGTLPFAAGTLVAPTFAGTSLPAAAAVEQTATKAAAHAVKRNDATPLGILPGAPPG